MLPFRDPLPGDMGDRINGVDVLDQLRRIAILSTLLADTLRHLRVFDRTACRLELSVFDISKKRDAYLPLLRV